MQSDMNQVLLCGPSTWCKEWPFSGKTFSTFCFKLDIGDRQSVFIDVPIDERKVKNSNYIALKQLIESKSGNYIAVNGIMIEKPDPKNEGSKRMSIRANLSGIGILTSGPIPLNRVYVSGTVFIPENAPANSFSVKTSYLNPKEKTYLDRNIPILGNSSGVPKPQEKVLVTGRLMSKLPNGEEKVYVQAEITNSFGAINRSYSKPVTKNNTVDFV